MLARNSSVWDYRADLIKPKSEISSFFGSIRNLKPCNPPASRRAPGREGRDLHAGGVEEHAPGFTVQRFLRSLTQFVVGL